jgi:hypothetical protein
VRVRQYEKEDLAKDAKVKSLLEEIPSNTLSTNFNPGSKTEPSAFKSKFKDGKQVSERKENIRVYYESNSKTTEKHTQIFYSDGTREENIETHTIFT